MRDAREMHEVRVMRAMADPSIKLAPQPGSGLNRVPVPSRVIHEGAHDLVGSPRINENLQKKRRNTALAR